MLPQLVPDSGFVCGQASQLDVGHFQVFELESQAHWPQYGFWS
jgi:hypothetical protein